MINFKKTAFVSVVCASLFCAPAFAQEGQSELRFGIIAHNLTITVAKNGDKEKGPDAQIEYVFGKHLNFGFLGSPRPLVTANINTQGETSFVAAGLDWQWQNDNFIWGAKFGLAVHDGDPLKNPYAPADSVRRAKFAAEELALGSRVLFRLNLNAGYQITENYALSVSYDHLSHGQILAKGTNQALDNIGLVLSRKF